MVSSGVRKSVWAQRGFREDLQYAEDDDFSRWCLAAGHLVRYVPESIAMHSHNYTATQAHKRAYGDGRALGQVWQGSATHYNWPKTVALGVLNDLRHDLAYCAKNHRLLELPHAALIRWQQRTGKLAGFRAGYQVQIASSAAPLTAS